MPRRLLILVITTALLLGTACSTTPLPAVDEPDGQGQENPPLDVDEPGGTDRFPAGTVVWEASIDSFSDLELIDGKLIFFDRDRIYSMDISTGEFIWDYRLSEDGFELQYGYGAELFIIHEEKGAISYVLLGDEGAYLEHLDISSGEKLWRQRIQDVSENDEVYFWTQGDLLFAQGSSSNITTPLRIRDGKPIPFPPQAAINSFEDSFYAFPSMPAGQFTPYTIAKYDFAGKMLWEAELDTQGEDYSGAFVSRLIDGTVLQNLYRFEGDQTLHRVYALDEGDGTVLWAKDGMIGDTMTVDNQKVYCLLAGDNASLLDPVTGQVVAEFVMDGAWLSSSDNTVCISGNDSLKALDVKTGTILWENNIGGFSYKYEESGILWGRTGQEFASDDRPEDKIYSIKIDTGEILTTVDIWGEQGGYGNPRQLQVIEVADKSYIYLGAIMADDGGEAAAIYDAATGERLWELPVYQYTLLISDQEEKSVLFTSTDSLRKVDLPTGEVVWEYLSSENLEYRVSLIGAPYLILSVDGADGEKILVYVDYYSGDELFRFTVEGSPRFIVEDDVLILEDRRLRRIAPPQP